MSLLDLKVDKNLIENNFEGYKLFLQEIPRVREKLPSGIHKTVPKIDQYSFKHAKLFSCHNHLIGESIEGEDFVYYIDGHRRINRTQLEPFTFVLSEVKTVWRVPDVIPVASYNISMQLIERDLAVVADGAGCLYIIETFSRGEIYDWRTAHSHMFPFAFIISDCRLIGEVLNCLLYSVENEEGKCYSILRWIKFEKNDTGWVNAESHEYKSKGDFHGGCFDGSEALVTISDYGFLQKSQVKSKNYIWTQNSDSISIKVRSPENKIRVTVEASNLHIASEETVVLSGNLYLSVDCELTTWTYKDGILDVELVKEDVGRVWPEIVVGDDNGVFLPDPISVKDAHERLAHLCSETETVPISSLLNTEEMEECDFPRTTNTVLERICGETLINKAIISPHNLLFMKTLQDDSTPAFALQQNEDALLWKMEATENSFGIKHSGTLMAFGYVQASKQRKKFVSCSPDLGYSVVCDATRHIFIYRQNKMLVNELRNRHEGRKIKKIAQQQVVDLTEDEILGVYCSNKVLFVLCESYIYALKMQN